MSIPQTLIRVTHPDERGVNNSDNSFTRRETLRDGDTEALKGSARCKTRRARRTLRSERAGVKDGAQRLRGIFAWRLRAVVEGDGDTDFCGRCDGVLQEGQ